MAVKLDVMAAGIAFGVKAQPGARKNAVRGEHDGCLRVSVTQAAGKGRANEAIAAVLGEALGLRTNQLALISGATNSRKRFVASGITVEELNRRIASCLTESS